MSMFPGQNLPPAILQEQWLNPWQNCKVVDLIPSKFFQMHLFSSLFKNDSYARLSLYLRVCELRLVVCLVPVLCHSTPAKGVVVVAGNALGPVSPGTGRAGMFNRRGWGRQTVAISVDPLPPAILQKLNSISFPRKERWSGSRPLF